MTHPPYPPQPGPPQQLPPPGFLKLHLQGNPLLSMITPSVHLDGQPVRVSYGENVIPVVPGQHRVDAHAQWMWEYGRAGGTFAVREGETAELWYAPPVLTFMKGAMGPHKQRIPGMLAFALVTGLVVLLVALVVIAAIASS